MTIAIIDDEPINRLVLKKIITEKCKDKKIIIEDGIIESSISKINELKPDILLLDIELKNGTGFDILNELNYNPEVIFTTAYEKYALQAIKAHAADYILKPIEENELYQALVRCANKIKQQTKTAQSNDLFFEISTNEGKSYINVNDILCFEGSGSYTYLTTKDEKILISKNIGDIESELEKTVFFRTHNSFIINMKHIKGFEIKRSGIITLNNEQIIPVSQRKKKDFIDILKANNYLKPESTLN